MPGIFHHACCCGCDGSACATCAAGTPESYTVTGSGILLNAANSGTCVDTTPAGASFPSYLHDTLSDVSFNTTKCIGQFTACGWAADFTAGGTNPRAHIVGRPYVDSACTNPGAGFGYVDEDLPFLWLLTKAAGKWTLTCIENYPGQGAAYIFYGVLDVTDPVDCYAPMTFTNLLSATFGLQTVDGVPGILAFGYAGIAVVTACCS